MAHLLKPKRMGILAINTRAKFCCSVKSLRQLPYFDGWIIVANWRACLWFIFFCRCPRTSQDLNWKGEIFVVLLYKTNMLTEEWVQNRLRIVNRETWFAAKKASEKKTSPFFILSWDNGVLILLIKHVICVQLLNASFEIIAFLCQWDCFRLVKCKACLKN